MNQVVLRTNNLCKAYSGNLVLNNVNMEIKKGDIYGFIGKNGAGKTTLMKIVCNLAAPTSGSIELFGKTEPGELLKARQRIGSIIEYPSLYSNMTAYENMEVQRRIIGAVGKTIIEDALKTVGLNDTGKKKAKAFSLGMKQRLGLAMALLNNPDLLVLDEPINGLDPTGIAEVRETLKQLANERNITILISSHILSELNLFATDYGIIDNGKLIKQLSSEDLKNECRQYIKLTTSEIAKTAAVLEEKLGTQNYTVMPNNEIRIFEYIDRPEYITQILIKENISLQGISVMGQDLESYFLELTGGANK